MKFSEESHRQLVDMGVNPDDYASDLFARFPTEASVIDQLISYFSDYLSIKLTTEAFNIFIEKSSVSCESPIHDHIYDIFNYLRMFNDGGKFTLFKGRQAEWDGPVVTLQKSDVPASNIDCLTDKSEIYRGMSSSELESSKFGQSWTTDINVARKFAFDTYGDKTRGLVAKAALEKERVIYYSDEDSESEVIMQAGIIKSAQKIET